MMSELYAACCKQCIVHFFIIQILCQQEPRQDLPHENPDLPSTPPIDNNEEIQIYTLVLFT